MRHLKLKLFLSLISSMYKTIKIQTSLFLHDKMVFHFFPFLLLKQNRRMTEEHASIVKIN